MRLMPLEGATRAPIIADEAKRKMVFPAGKLQGIHKLIFPLNSCARPRLFFTDN